MSASPHGAARERATLADVAREAGVSHGTAMRAFGKPGRPVSKAIGMAVLDAAARLDYRPSSQTRPWQEARS